MNFYVWPAHSRYPRSCCLLHPPPLPAPLFREPARRPSAGSSQCPGHAVSACFPVYIPQEYCDDKAPHSGPPVDTPPGTAACLAARKFHNHLSPFEPCIYSQERERSMSGGPSRPAPAQQPVALRTAPGQRADTCISLSLNKRIAHVSIGLTRDSPARGRKVRRDGGTELTINGGWPPFRARTHTATHALTAAPHDRLYAQRRNGRAPPGRITQACYVLRPLWSHRPAFIFKEKEKL